MRLLGNYTYESCIFVVKLYGFCLIRPFRDVTSGVPRKACWGEFSIAMCGNVAYVQTAAAFAYRGIPNSVVADRSVQCQTKSDGVQTTTVEKVDAGTLDRCQGSLVFPLYTKQQSSERRPCSHIIAMENSPQQAFRGRGTPGVTSRIRSLGPFQNLLPSLMYF